MFTGMAKAKNPFSNDTFLAVLGILAGVCAFVFVQWAAKGQSVLFALMLIVYAGRRHDSRPLIRYPVAIAAICVFAFGPSAKIWADFYRNYPATAWPEFVTWRSFQGVLAITAILALRMGVEACLAIS